MAQYQSRFLDETRDIARKILIECTKSASETRGAVVVALSGNLGAGKTTFVKAVAEALGVSQTVTSPTFVIQKIYKLDEAQPFDHLVHIDAYRLESGSELTDLGWKLLTKDNGALIFVEWPEKVEDVLPTNTIKIKLEVLDEKTREITAPF